jgi:hypothetical protein
MKFFYERLAKRLDLGQDVTFEKQACALDLEAALKDLGKPCHVTPEGHRYRVWVHAAGQEVAHAVEVSVSTPAEIPSPAQINGVTETRKSAQNISDFFPRPRNLRSPP